MTKKLACHKIGRLACYTLEDNKQLSPAILWIHGYTLNAEIWPDVWEFYPDAFHIAIELPDHGQSENLNSFTSLQDLSLEVIVIADYYNVSHIAGFSFGGILALQMVIEQPERFLTLSLISSPVGGKLVDEDAMVKNQRLIKLFSTKGKGRWLTELWLQSPPHIFTALKKYVTKFGFISEIIDKHQWNELADNRFSLFTTTNQLIPGLQKIKSKVFLYVGEEDMEYIKRCNELLSRRLVNFERLYLADCGHLPILEKPPMVMGLIKQNIISIL